MSPTARSILQILGALYTLCAGIIAASAQDRDVCLERDGARSLEACSRVIAANQLTGKELATIYVVRASIYRATQQYDLAIANLTSAIGLLRGTASNEVVASAYTTRASIYSLAGRQSDELADYKQALALDASNAQASTGIRNLQDQITTSRETQSANAAQFPPPNEPMPQDFPIPPQILEIIRTEPLFANAPPVKIGGYAYQQLSISKVNGFVVRNSLDYDASVKWLRPGVISEQTIMNSTTRHTMEIRTKSTTLFVGAANGLVGFGYKASSITYMPNSKPTTATSASVIERLENLQGSIFPIRVGNRFSYDAVFRETNSYQPEDEKTESELCEITQRYQAATFHPDLTGSAYLETCQEHMSFKRNKTNDVIVDWRTLYFDELGITIRVDPQSPPQKIIQTYFKDETDETARLQSFIMAR